jgi:hypothetical protein
MKLLIILRLQEKQHELQQQWQTAVAEWEQREEERDNQLGMPLLTRLISCLVKLALICRAVVSASAASRSSSHSRCKRLDLIVILPMAEEHTRHDYLS